MQDSKGYIWVASDLGVARFNGYEFQRFTTREGLPDNTIFECSEDYKGRIWFRSISGKLSYFFNDSIHILPINDTLVKLFAGVSGVINTLFVDKSDTLWIGSFRGRGPIKVSMNDFKIQLVKYDSSIAYIIKRDSTHFIFGDNPCLFNAFGKAPPGPEKTTEPLVKAYYFGQGPRIQYAINIGNVHAYRDGWRLRNVVSTKAHEMIATVNGCCAKFVRDSLVYRKEFETGINSIYCDPQGGLWVSAMLDGVYYYPDGDFRAEPALHLFQHKTVSSTFEDREGAFWFSTTTEGVYYVSNKDFLNFTSENKLPGNNVKAVLSDGPNTWVGIAPLFNAFVVSETTRTAALAICGPAFKNGFVQHIYKHSDGTMWVGATTGLSVFSSKPPFNTIVGPDRYFYAVQYIEEADSGWVWLLNPQFISKVKRVGNKIRIDAHGPIFFPTRLSAMTQTKAGTIWVGSSAGLLQLVHDSIVTVPTKNRLLKNKITGIKEDGLGQLWLATGSSGVLLMKGDSVQQFTVAQGMISNVCRYLFIDSLNTVWVGTNSGVSRISRIKSTAGYEITNYTEKSGLASNEVNCIYVKKNKVCVATNGGLTFFDASKELSNKIAPCLYITHVHVNGKNLPLEEKFDLSYNENFITIDFIGLSYKDASNIQYRYKLSGVDTGWVYTKYRSIQYPTLPPGSYRFEVSAMNNDGVWNKVPASIAIHISPPWWATWWFRISVVLLAAGFIFWRIKKIESREMEKTKLNKQVAEMELNALRAQMNPHFIFNAINSIQHFIMKNEQESAHRYLSKFSKLIRNVLDNSRTQLITIQQEIDTLDMYIGLEVLRFEEKNKFNYTIEVNPEIDKEETEIPSMLIQPYIENAIWHGLMHLSKDPRGVKRVGNLLVKLEPANDKTLRCIVEDNGVGRQKAMEYKSLNKVSHKSIGMEVTKERLEILNQTGNIHLSVQIIDLVNESGEGMGTRVEIAIPLKN